ncbi:MAG: T9SS type A sorting domain-containing protein, partial [Ignavibacteria bacterium]|nr:T9SS type A sorting domain-containing protein [Ignavibacteria bacterium]
AYVTVDKNNDIIVNGYYYLGKQYAFNTIKYNSSGKLLWNRIYKGDGNLNFCFALCTDDSANVYAAGRSTNTGTGADFVTIKYYSNGDTAWIRIFDGGFNQADEIYSIALDKSQNIYVTGRSDSLNGISDYLTIKYDLDGVLKWKYKYDGNFLVDRSFCISLDIGNNIIISGFSQTNANDFSITTIKYSTITGVNENIYEENEIYLLNNFPNPFNSETIINYQIPSTGNISINIYDSKGSLISEIIKQYQLKGIHQTSFNAYKYSSGVYFYTLVFNNKLVKTSRMFLIK